MVFQRLFLNFLATKINFRSVNRVKLNYFELSSGLSSGFFFFEKRKSETSESGGEHEGKNLVVDFEIECCEDTHEKPQ